MSTLIIFVHLRLWVNKGNQRMPREHGASSKATFWAQRHGTMGIIDACIQDLWTVPDECSIRSNAAPIKSVSYFLQWWPFSLARFALSNSCPWPSFFQALQRVSSKKRWRAEGGLSDSLWLWTCCYVGIQLVSSFLHHKYPLHNNSIGI